MKTLATALAFALAITAVGSPAAAGDRIFVNTDEESILTDFDGRAVWELQAMCAGYHRATATYWKNRGKSDRSRSAARASAQATDDVVTQLKRDRGITDRGEAINTAASYEQVGYRLTEQALARDGVADSGRWNFWRSVCLAAKRVYQSQ